MQGRRFWPEPPRSRSAPPRSRPPVPRRGGLDIQAGMAGIIARFTGPPCAFMPARSTAAVFTGAWCGRRMVPPSAG